MSEYLPSELTTVEPLADNDWPAELACMLSGFAGQLNVYRTMAHHPALLSAWASLREHVVNQSALSKEALEVVILRAGFNLNSDYEWSHQVVRARKLGMSDARIASVRGRPDTMEAQDQLLATGVDELFQSSKIRPATQSRLVATFGLKAVFDLMATVGFYSTLGYILNTFETPLDKELAADLDAHPLDA
jgi:alkylhydroperoxidase family enzyme